MTEKGHGVAMKLITLPVKQIKQVENARTNIKAMGLAGLMASMRHSGLLEPIGVRAVGKEHEIVFGNRRFEAALKLGWENIDCVVVQAESDEEMMLLNVVENMQREGVSLREQGRIFTRLKESGLSHSEIGARTGIPGHKITAALDLYRRMPKRLQNKVRAPRTGGAVKALKEEGEIAPTAAFVALNVCSRFNLDTKQKEKLFTYAGRRGVGHETLRNVGYLMGQGKSLADAIKEADRYIIVTLSIGIDKKKCQAVEDKENLSINDILRNRLCAFKDLGVLMRLKQPKKHGRTLPKAARYLGKEE